MRRGLILAVAASFAVAVGTCDAAQVRVTGVRVNVRSGPGEAHGIVGMAERGDVLTVRSRSSSWVEVVPPAGTELWVHRDFVDEGVIVGAQANVRTGPSVRDTTLVTLERGAKIVVKGETGDWFRIAPPAGISFWISDALVETVAGGATPPPAPAAPRAATPTASPPAPTVARAAEPVAPAPPAPAPATPPARVVPPPAPPRPAPAPAPTRAIPPPPRPQPPAPAPAPAVTPPVSRAAAMPPPPAPAVGESARVVPTPSPAVGPVADRAAPRRDSPAGRAPRPTASATGQSAVYEGVVQSAPWVLFRPSRHRLVVRGDVRSDTACYLVGLPTELDNWVGRRVRVSGRESFVQGVREAVLIVERIQPL